MILCFSGTGNSKYIADALADRLNESVVSLNDVIKNDLKRQFNSATPFIIVAPIYAWRFPRIVDDIVKFGSFTGTKDIYFVATMGSQTGNCFKYCEKIASTHGLHYMGFRGIKMPNNYVVDSVMADEATNDAILESAITEVDEIALAIRNRQVINKTDRTPLPGLLSGPVNNSFTKYMCSAKNYTVSEECIFCGKCASLCPMNNVSIKEGEHPTFGTKCINCFACLQYCPKQAINIAGKTEKHGRYTCKEYKSN